MQKSHGKRKVKDEPIILDDKLLPQLANLIQNIKWTYKVNMETLQKRDKALVAFILLTGVRASETQQLRRKQTRIYNTHILVVNVQPLKRGNLREEIILPKSGGLAPFTAIFEEWLRQVPGDNSVLFPSATPDGALLWDTPLSRYRIHRIVKVTTGMFPHWFRGVCETIYGKQIFQNDAWALKDFMGLVNLNSTSPYVSGQWKQHVARVYKLRL